MAETLNTEQLIECFESIKQKYVGDEYYEGLFNKRKFLFPDDMDVTTYQIFSAFSYIQSCAAMDGIIIEKENIKNALAIVLGERCDDTYDEYVSGSVKAYHLDLANMNL